MSTTPRYLYSELANAIQARRNCAERMARATYNTPNASNGQTCTDVGAEEWFCKWSDRIDALVSEHMPSGSGFDNGTKIDLNRSHAKRLVFTTAYHHMNENGYYDGWTEHTVIVTPSFSGFNMRVTGRDRNETKDYIVESFDYALSTDLSDQIEFERLAPIHGLVYRWNWIDQCTQTWNVYGPVAGVETLIKSAFRSWIDARKFAVEYMQAIEQTGKGI